MLNLGISMFVGPVAVAAILAILASVCALVGEAKESWKRREWGDALLNGVLAAAILSGLIGLGIILVIIGKTMLSRQVAV